MASGIGDAFNGFGIDLGNVGAGINSFIQGLIIFIVIAVVVGVVLYFAWNKKVYNKKIQILEEINGVTVPTKQYSAREVDIPNTSIKVFQIKENKMFLPRPTIQTGKDNYLMFIRDDHEWINVGMDSLNAQLTRMGLKYNHVDMRYANASLKELIKANYGENDWLKKYGIYVALGLFVILMGISFYLVADKLNETIGQLDTIMARNEALTREIVEKTQTSGLVSG